MQIIPAIDIINGQCVRLSQGDYATKTVYPTDPVMVACNFAHMGFSRLHIVDLDGARMGHLCNIDVLRRIMSATNLQIDYGGGIKTREDLTAVFEAGASLASIGSLAVKKRELFLSWVNEFGAERFILCADIRKEKVCISGWTEESEIDWKTFIGFYMQHGIRNILCTEISRDGMLQGPAIELYKNIKRTYPECNLIASGGVSCIKDIKDLSLAGIPAAVVGKALYEKKIRVEDLCLRNE